MTRKPEMPTTRRFKGSLVDTISSDRLPGSLWSLPDDQPPQDPEASPFPPDAEKPGLPRTRALLVEDNRADRLIVEEAILEYGLPIDLHVLEDGQKAFEYIERVDRGDAPCPEILLLDLNLPKRSGKEVLERARQSPKCKNIPILIVTSSNSPVDRQETAKLGANGYFCKPNDYDEFLKVGAALKALLDEHRA